jgi:hypothetical protein
MEQNFDVNRTSRTMILNFLENYSVDQLNAIPAGSSNNLIWNIAHVVVTQQLLVYKLSGLSLLISDELVEKYKKGTTVNGLASATEIETIKSLLLETIDQTQRDYNAGVFKNHTEYPTSTGFVIKNIEGAIAFNNFHEGLHLGIMMRIKKGL